MFAQSDPDLVDLALADAGFQASLAPRPRWSSPSVEPDEAADYLADTGPGRAILATIPTDRHDEVIGAVHHALLPHRHADRGVTLNAAVWVATAATRERSSGAHLRPSGGARFRSADQEDAVRSSVQPSAMPLRCGVSRSRRRLATLRVPRSGRGRRCRARRADRPTTSPSWR